MRDESDFFVGDVGQCLKHLIIDFRISYPDFFHIADSSCAVPALKLVFIFLPGVIIACHLELAFREDDLDVFFDQIMLFAVNISNYRRAAVLSDKFSEIKNAQ